MKKLILFFSCFVIALQIQAQNVLKDVYPIGESPNIGYKTSMVPDIETLIFEANPIVRLSLFNTFQQNLQRHEEKKASALYFNFKPQIRMYDDNSKPVRMPSYHIGIAYQHLIRVPNVDDALLAFSIESGHYSNGQDRSSFSTDYEDGSTESNDLYNLITDESNLSAMINRKSGNFSTNFSEVNVKWIKAIGDLNGNNVPNSSYSVQLGYNRFHNRLLVVLPDIGGYTENDIKIYGKNRFNLYLNYMNSFHSDENKIRDWRFDRYVFSTSFHLISKPHASVNPFRTELTGKLFFQNNFGFFISGIYGHDNYNLRMVDDGFQVFLGIVFDSFPRIQWKN